MNIVSISESSVVILCTQTTEPDNFSVIQHALQTINFQMKEVIVDIIPSYTSIHITFNLLKMYHEDFTRDLTTLLQSLEDITTIQTKGKSIDIPVYYGEEVALDLAWVACRAQLSKQDVIDIHSSRVYDVYAIGFTPGFAYLGNIDQRITSPRKETPRQKVTQGSLGIADQQTAIDPADSPGGWQIIGKTLIPLVNYSHEDLTPFSIGDKITFSPIKRSEYIHMGGVLPCR